MKKIIVNNGTTVFQTTLADLEAYNAAQVALETSQAAEAEKLFKERFSLLANELGSDISETILGRGKKSNNGQGQLK